MLHHTKYLAGTIALLLVSSLFAAEFKEATGLTEGENTSVSSSSTNRFSDFTLHEKLLLLQMLKSSRSGEEYNEPEMAVYRKYLASDPQPDRPANLPAEAFHNRDLNLWTIIGEKTLRSRDVWNSDGTLFQPFYAWKVYYTINPNVIAATDYAKFTEAYNVKFSGISVDLSAFELVVAPYNFGSAITLNGCGSVPAFNNFVFASTGEESIELFLTMFWEKVTAVTVSGAPSAAASAVSLDA